MFDRQGRRKYLNGTERQAYFDILKSEADEAARLFGLTLFHTGCRISEALNLTTERIDLSQKCVVFETLKRRKRGLFRAVPIPDIVVRRFDEFLTGTAPCDPVWGFSRPTAYRSVKEQMMLAGVAGAMASPKGLRHGFAIACTAQNIPLPMIQKWLGHARLETTALYLGVLGDEERSFASRLWSHLQN